VVAALGGRSVQAGVVDRDRSPAGQDDGRLLVSVREGFAALLLGQVQVAPDLLADRDRHAQERLHLRVRGREAVRLRMVADVPEAQRPRVLDQHAEDAAPAREVPDGTMRVRIDARGDEALELLPAVVQDAHGRVPRSGHVAGDVEQLMEHRLDVELGDQAAPCVDQAPEAELVKGRLGHLGRAPTLWETA
jgi:hypothetical protein